MKLSIGKQIILVGAGLTVLFGLVGAAAGGTVTSPKAAARVAIEAPTPQAPAAPAPSDEPTNDPTITITAKDVVDFMGPKAVSKFCDAYFTIGDYDTAFHMFKKGFDSETFPGAPSAQDVFDEVLSRC